MSNFISIGVYPKGRKRGGVVFRKNSHILYRITTLERANLFVDHMYQYSKDLSRKQADPNFVLELMSPRNKSHVLEIELMEDMTELRVYEMIQGTAIVRFKWNGGLLELKDGLKSFGVMMLALRF